MAANFYRLTKSQLITMEVLLCIGTLFYVGLLALDGYNLFWFLYKQGRSQIIFIKSFYSLTTLIIVLRISEFTLMLVLLFAAHNQSITTSERFMVFTEALDGVANYLTICVGLFQIVAMIVLTM